MELGGGLYGNNPSSGWCIFPLSPPSRLRQRLKELQVRAVALGGSAMVAGLIGAANLLARVLYAQHFADSGGE